MFSWGMSITCQALLGTKIMRKLLLAALCAAPLGLAAGQSSAAILYDFEGGAATPGGNYVVIDQFVDASGITAGANYQIKTPPADGDGAPPANSSPAGTSYLSVLGGGTATYSFLSAVHGFQFDWGSVDTYNTLTIHSSAGDFVVTGGAVGVPPFGNQVLPGTNGRFTVYRTAGETFTGFTLASSENSFEIDNVAVVPEPATWAMMIIGFAGVGGMVRRRRYLFA